MAPGWTQGKGGARVSMLLNKSQLQGKTELQKAWCLCVDDQIWTNLPLLDRELHLYILRPHPSRPDRYTIISPSLLLNGLDAMDLASYTQFRGPCQFIWSLSALVQSSQTNVYSPTIIRGCPETPWWFVCDTISMWWAAWTCHCSCLRSQGWWKCVTEGFWVILWGHQLWLRSILIKNTYTIQYTKYSTYQKP